MDNWSTMEWLITTKAPATFQVPQSMETSVSLEKKISKIRWLFRIQTTYAAACLH